MANLFDSRIKCTDRKALRKITKIVLKHTPSRILEKSKDVVVFETRWKDLGDAMEIISKDYPNTTFSCDFIHMTTCYEYYKTLIDYKNGDVIFKGLEPVFLYNCKELDNLIELKLDVFSKIWETYFSTMYETRKLDDGTYILDFIPDKYTNMEVHISNQFTVETEDYYLIATLSHYSRIGIDIKLKKNSSTIS